MSRVRTLVATIVTSCTYRPGDFGLRADPVYRGGQRDAFRETYQMGCLIENGNKDGGKKKKIKTDVFTCASSRQPAVFPFLQRVARAKLKTVRRLRFVGAIAGVVSYTAFCARCILRSVLRRPGNGFPFKSSAALIFDAIRTSAVPAERHRRTRLSCWIERPKFKRDTNFERFEPFSRRF